MITLKNIHIQYGDRILLDHINLTIGVKDKTALVGKNGTGKSTLLKIITGEIVPDSGEINIPNSASIGYLRQEMDFPKGKTVMEETLTAFGELMQLKARIEEINTLISAEHHDPDKMTHWLNELHDLNHRFEVLGGHTMDADTQKTLKGLGFTEKDFNRKIEEFSGGWKMRIELAKILLRRPDYLLLDEPTNHLDIESIIWLENFLKDYSGSVLLISHDKTFLDNISKKTVEIELSKVFEYKAPYSQFKKLREERREKQLAAFNNQQKTITQKERTIKRFMAKATKTKMAQSMQKQLDKIERIEIDTEDNTQLKIRFPEAKRPGQIIAEAINTTKKYGNLTVLENINFKLDRGDRVAFVGQNGQGKTTLARILLGDLKATTGTVTPGYNVETAYYAQNQTDSLDNNATVLQAMENASPAEMRTKLRTLLGAFRFSGEDVEKKISVLSGGEKSRLALAIMLLRPSNFIILDEPTNHLDIPSKEVLKQALLDYNGSLIIVSHDRDFLSGLTNRVIEFRDHRLHEYIGDINEFLRKRKADNMREIELRNKQKDSGKKVKAATLSYEQRKQLQRAVKYAERDIEKLEEKITAYEAQMAKQDFYASPDYKKIMQAHREAQEKLEETMERWENAVEELGE